jgi:hypothetical protein
MNLWTRIHRLCAELSLSALLEYLQGRRKLRFVWSTTSGPKIANLPGLERMWSGKARWMRKHRYSGDYSEWSLSALLEYLQGRRKLRFVWSTTNPTSRSPLPFHHRGKRKGWNVCRGRLRVSPLGHRSRPVSFLLRLVRKGLDASTYVPALPLPPYSCNTMSDLTT